MLFLVVELVDGDLFFPQGSGLLPELILKCIGAENDVSVCGGVVCKLSEGLHGKIVIGGIGLETRVVVDEAEDFMALGFP